MEGDRSPLAKGWNTILSVELFGNLCKDVIPLNGTMVILDRPPLILPGMPILGKCDTRTHISLDMEVHVEQNNLNFENKRDVVQHTTWSLAILSPSWE